LKSFAVCWSGREYQSIEHCLVTIHDAGVEIDSAIVGRYHETIYRVEYRIKCTPKWETTYCKIRSRLNGVREEIILERGEDEIWRKNGERMPELSGCSDVDIPLTPFTNTLPIRRLNLDVGSSQQIRVVYLDLLQRKIEPVQQFYRRIDGTTYHYENVPNDFEADIIVDEHGLVLDYPSLFRRELIVRDPVANSHG
jgi:hypothetical protein